MSRAADSGDDDKLRFKMIHDNEIKKKKKNFRQTILEEYREWYRHTLQLIYDVPCLFRGTYHKFVILYYMS